MVKVVDQLSQYHGTTDVGLLYGGFSQPKQTPDFGSIYFYEVDQFSYNFENFFHPYVGRLIAKLNRTSVAGMLDPQFLGGLVEQYTAADYALKNTKSVSTALQPRNIDVSIGGPYANYNWEMLYHIPVMIAVHLSNNQRFAEAQKWFHLVFDPTTTDTSVPPPQRYWRSFVFHDSTAC